MGKPCFRIEKEKQTGNFSCCSAAWMGTNLCIRIPVLLKLIIIDNLKNRNCVCLFLRQTQAQTKPTWVTADQRITQPRSFPADEHCYQNRGFAPHAQDTHTTAFWFLVQVVLCSHGQSFVTMKQSLELT